MTHKRILFHFATREKTFRETAALADTVRMTLELRSKVIPMQIGGLNAKP